jgi:uncharacterized protein
MTITKGPGFEKIPSVDQGQILSISCESPPPETLRAVIEE